MSFWEHIYELRGKGLIPREWNRADLRSHLEGSFAPNTITTVPSNRD